jgi:nucleotide-binding universal stress UspA family protein
MYQRILVPVAADDAENAAVEHAISLAASVGATLRLVHVVEEEMAGLFDVSGVDIVSSEEEEAAAAHSYITAAAERARERGVPVETAVIASEGARASDAILADADQWRADLVVMSTRAHGGLAEALFGSIDKEVVQRARVPVLLVHAP